MRVELVLLFEQYDFLLDKLFDCNLMGVISSIGSLEGRDDFAF